MTDNDLALLTREMVSKDFILPMSTLDYLVATGQIPYFRITKRNIRFRRSELLEWLETRRDIPYRRGGNNDAE